MRDSYGSYVIEDSSVADRSMNIILDMGIKFSKVGFAGEIEPRKIIRTPNIFDNDKFLNDCARTRLADYIKNQNNQGSEEQNTSKPIEISKNIIHYFRSDYDKIRLEFEEFFHMIIYNILQIQKLKNNKLYSVCLLIDPFVPKLDKIYDILTKIILENPNIQAVKILPKIVTPIFASGYNSGLIVDLGVLHSSILPINEGLPYFNLREEVKLNYTDIERDYKLMIIEDNIISPLNPKIPKIKNIDLFCETLNPGLDDLLTRTMFCVNRKIVELMKNPTELNKIKNELNKVDHNFGSFYSCMLRRVQIGTKFFGDFDNEDEVNLAYSLLKCLKNLPCEDRKKLCGNIVLNGGLTMTVGLYKRLVEEINYILDLNKEENSEFYELLPLRDHIKVHKILFPRNNLSWIGCSLLYNLESFNVKHLTIMREDVNEEEKIKKNVTDLGSLVLDNTKKVGIIDSNFRTSFRKFEIDKEIPLLNKIINYFREK